MRISVLQHGYQYRVLTFQVRKQDYPLEISKVNTDIYAYFVSDNGSSTGRVQVDYVNPMQGIIQLTLDNDFLKAQQTLMSQVKSTSKLLVVKIQLY